MSTININVCLHLDSYEAAIFVIAFNDEYWLRAQAIILMATNVFYLISTVKATHRRFILIFFSFCIFLGSSCIIVFQIENTEVAPLVSTRDILFPLLQELQFEQEIFLRFAAAWAKPSFSHSTLSTSRETMTGASDEKS